MFLNRFRMKDIGEASPRKHCTIPLHCTPAGCWGNSECNAGQLASWQQQSYNLNNSLLHLLVKKDFQLHVAWRWHQLRDLWLIAIPLNQLIPTVALEPVISSSAGGLLDPAYPWYTNPESLVWTLQAYFLPIATQVMWEHHPGVWKPPAVGVDRRQPALLPERRIIFKILVPSCFLMVSRIWAWEGTAGVFLDSRRCS